MGLIYLAFNTKTNKSYIGQTTHTLEHRKNQHLTRTIKTNTKFGRALQLYSYDKWNWTIIKDDVPKNKLDYEEMFYIKALNTFAKGYNSTGGGQFGYKTLINNPDNLYCFYHKEHKDVEATISELSKLYNLDEKILFDLVLGKVNYLSGWILEENKSIYNKIQCKQLKQEFKDKYLNIPLSVFHWKVGKIKTNVYAFHKLQNLKVEKILKLINNELEHLNNWYLIKTIDNKEIHLDIKVLYTKSKVVKLNHPKIGIVEGSLEELCFTYKLNMHKLHKLVNKKVDRYNKWTLIDC